MSVTVGETIPAGTLVLITGGSYSSYGVSGLFRAPKDTIVPGRQSGASYFKAATTEVDTHLLSTMLEELVYVEAWADD